MTAVAIAARPTPPPELCRRAAVRRLLRYAAIDWMVIIAAWLAMATTPAWLFPLGVLVVAGRLHALGVVLHDACHMGRRADTRGLALLQCLAGYPIATTLPAMRYHHLRHHRSSGMAGDPYFKPGVSTDPWLATAMRLRGLLLVPAWIVRCFYGCAALAWPRLVPSYARAFLQDRSGDDLARSFEVRDCLREEPKQAAFFIAVFVVAWRHPAAVGAFYLGPLVLAGALNVHRVIVEHVHVPCADRRPETVAATTVTHDLGMPGKLFLFPHNIGFHVVHHLYPQAALECLPALHRWHAAATSVRRDRSEFQAPPAEEDRVTR
jgi:fatty acid desaturase